MSTPRGFWVSNSDSKWQFLLLICKHLKNRSQCNRNSRRPLTVACCCCYNYMSDCSPPIVSVLLTSHIFCLLKGFLVFGWHSFFSFLFLSESIASHFLHFLKRWSEILFSYNGKYDEPWILPPNVWFFMVFGVRKGVKQSYIESLGPMREAIPLASKPG